MNDKDIKNRIARYRREHNLSQAEIAERLSISQTAYYKIERGKTSLISEHLPKIADALDLSEEALVLGYEPGEKEKYESIIAEKDRRIAELRQEQNYRTSGPPFAKNLVALQHVERLRYRRHHRGRH